MFQVGLLSPLFQSSPDPKAGALLVRPQGGGAQPEFQSSPDPKAGRLRSILFCGGSEN